MGEASTIDPVYIDEKRGRDSTTQRGSQLLPYRTLAFAYQQQPRDSPDQYLVRKEAEAGAASSEGKEDQVPGTAAAAPATSSDEAEWKSAAKTAYKKAVAFAQQQQKKQAREKELSVEKEKQEESRRQVLEAAKEVKLVEDTKLPKPKRIQLDEKVEAGTRVKVFGRVHRERKQKDVLFVTLRDGYGQLQCVLAGQLAKTYDALTLTRETSMELYGEIKDLPEGAHAPGNRELLVDFYQIHPGWKAAGGDDAITNRVQAQGDPQTLLDLRHLTLRGDIASAVMIVRDAVEFAFQTAFREARFRKVSPPALVQTQVEGGATLFKFDYYGETAYLTQSSQLYLETCLPSLGNVYCIEKSFRAEKSLTRRHLSEYSHIEAELDFVTFDDLLANIESIIARVLELVLADPTIAAHIKDLNPDFKPPQLPFKRMKYTEAIDWLREHDILDEEGKPHEFGTDIAESAERRMVDTINQTIFLTHFPVEVKAFYMQKDKADRRVTESVDVLAPGVGEILGGSMRMDDYEELMEAYKREGIDPAAYYWYTSQRQYGSSPHGGYGLGLERFLAWLLNRHTVRDTCLYPRYAGRCTP